MNNKLFNKYISSLDLSCVRAVYFYETFFDVLTIDFTNHSYHQRNFEIAAL